MKPENRGGMLRFAVIAIVLAISLLVGLVVYYNSLVGNLQYTSCKALEEVLQQEKSNFAKTINRDMEMLKGFAEILSAKDERDLENILLSIAKSTDFEYISYAQPDGASVNQAGERTNVFDRAYFQSALAGETVISDPIKSKLRDDNIVAIATPIVRDNKTIGVLFGSLKASRLNELFMGSFDGYGYTYVATNSGEVIAKTESIYALAQTSNLLDEFQSVEFYKNDSYETMRHNLVDGGGGHAQYRFGDEERLLHYDKLGINDWNVFVLVNAVGVGVTANQILRNTILLTASMLAIFVILLIYNLMIHKQFTHKLEKMAYVDAVTGFRSFGKFRIDAIELIQNNPTAKYVLVIMDIENFKLVNEIFTMEVGNRLLRAEAEAINAALDPALDAFCRIHADEFALLVSYEGDEGRLLKKRAFDGSFSGICTQLIGYKPVLPQGRCELQPGDTDFDNAYERANFAHRIAKSGDLKEICYDGKIKAQALQEKEMENRMEAALAAGEFKMFLQPKYRLADEKMIGAEALVRWISEDGTITPPGDFVPLFERNGFITQIDLFMFEQVCKMLRRWIDNGIEPFPISVNFSRLHLGNPSFVETLSATAMQYRVLPALLELELTETVMLESMDTLQGVLQKVHEVGFALSMDDFGTGYSSLGLLKNISVDVIKIDRSFFEGSKDLARAKAVISGVIDMARRLGIHTVAEGVETQADIDFLNEMGCDTVQGYYYAKPMPVDSLELKLVRDLFAKG